ncbi:hypothetical protein FA15DRAFT_756955 [Coprinopsis marcescibilis]|uniref:Uncharacterized protein n=1 Tax=Coprinopsis marcescibilis TaxID=230819 RepID=A0A5C3L6H7_COPMA|nr:hypothetical protein FA15DRAFT_756955 [Coprinopsis marcescibilis]
MKGIELDKQWKAALRARIQEDFQDMKQDLTQNLYKQLRLAPMDEDRIRTEYQQALLVLDESAEWQYREELAQEYELRITAVGCAGDFEAEACHREVTKSTVGPEEEQGPSHQGRSPQLIQPTAAVGQGDPFIMQLEVDLSRERIKRQRFEAQLQRERSERENLMATFEFLKQDRLERDMGREQHTSLYTELSAVDIGSKNETPQAKRTQESETDESSPGLGITWESENQIMPGLGAQPRDEHSFGSLAPSRHLRSRLQRPPSEESLPPASPTFSYQSTVGPSPGRTPTLTFKSLDPF